MRSRPPNTRHTPSLEEILDRGKDKFAPPIFDWREHVTPVTLVLAIGGLVLGFALGLFTGAAL